MATVSAKIDDKKGVLVITIPMNEKPEPSKTFKTMQIASSRGNQETELTIPDGRRVTIGVNAYVKATDVEKLVAQEQAKRAQEAADAELAKAQAEAAKILASS